MSECKECAEQARLLGISGSRESRMRSVLEEAFVALAFIERHCDPAGLNGSAEVAGKVLQKIRELLK
jgi:hypothetical protein